MKPDVDFEKLVKIDKAAERKAGPPADRGHLYNQEAVQQAIVNSCRPISSREAKMIHAVLKGRA